MASEMAPVSDQRKVDRLGGLDLMQQFCVSTSDVIDAMRMRARPIRLPRPLRYSSRYGTVQMAYFVHNGARDLPELR